MNQNITINQINTGKRLDIFLVENFPENSRSQWQKRIKAGEVLVNGEKRVVHYFLKENDKIIISNQQSTINNENTKPDTDKNLSNEIKIVSENSEYLVIDKPAGMVVHPNNKHEDNTLVDYVLEKYPEVGKVGESPERPGVVHRLDKEVSGLMVIARNQDMFDCLKSQFKSRQVNKEYIALVHGQIENAEERINLAISRSKAKGFFVAKHKNDLDERSKKAVTDIGVLERFHNFTLLKVKILTGRTHQIRVHLKSIGHSVVGDKLYVTHDIRVKKKQVDLERIFLHASLLGFKDMNNEYQEFKSDLSKGLDDFLLTLK